MAIKFDLGNGTFVYAPTDGMLIKTNHGMVAALAVVQGDFICNVQGQPLLEVVSVPEVL